jgi:hypothetical protein
VRIQAVNCRELRKQLSGCHLKPPAEAASMVATLNDPGKRKGIFQTEEKGKTTENIK